MDCPKWAIGVRVFEMLLHIPSLTIMYGWTIEYTFHEIINVMRRCFVQFFCVIEILSDILGGLCSGIFEYLRISFLFFIYLFLFIYLFINKFLKKKIDKMLSFLLVLLLQNQTLKFYKSHHVFYEVVLLLWDQTQQDFFGLILTYVSCLAGDCIFVFIKGESVKLLKHGFGLLSKLYYSYYCLTYSAMQTSINKIKFTFGGTVYLS